LPHYNILCDVTLGRIDEITARVGKWLSKLNFLQNLFKKYQKTPLKCHKEISELLLVCNVRRHSHISPFTLINHRHQRRGSENEVLSRSIFDKRDASFTHS
jgi:hypothetical protein